MKRAPPVMPSSYSRGETDLFAVMLVFGNIGALSAGSSDVVSALYFRNIKETIFREVHRWLLFYWHNTSIHFQPAICCLQSLLVSLWRCWQLDSKKEQNFTTYANCCLPEYVYLISYLTECYILLNSFVNSLIQDTHTPTPSSTTMERKFCM